MSSSISKLHKISGRTLLALCIAVSSLVAGPSSISPVQTAVAQDLLPDATGPFGYHQFPRYRESESHPLRVIAYVIHPVGWVLREAIFRPISAFAGSTALTKQILGFREPYDFQDTFCFRQTGIPDCWNTAPLNMLSSGPPTEFMDMGDTGDAGAMVSSERQVFIPDVNFDYDRSSLNSLGKGRVRQIAQLLASVPDLTIVVEGHTDYKGGDQYNQSLGAKRAQAVIRELTDLGIDPGRMSPVSYGESRPIFTEEEDWARAVNRRVQFSVAGADAPLPADTGMPAAELSDAGVSPAPAQVSTSTIRTPGSVKKEMEAVSQNADEVAASDIEPDLEAELDEELEYEDFDEIGS